MQHAAAVQEHETTVLVSAKGRYSLPVKPVATNQKPQEALRLFGSFLCNSEAEANALGNVIMVWESLPKFAGEYLNTTDGTVPNDCVIEFALNGKTAKLTLFPGTYYSRKKNSKPMRRYPGVKEQAVEQALIHQACVQAEEHTINGETSYYVTFTMNSIGRTLKLMGSTMSNSQIREALEVLSSSVMTISYGDDLIQDKRNTILPSFDRNVSSQSGNNGDDLWRVKLHPLIAHSILNVTYKQFPFSAMRNYSPPGAFLLRRMHYIKANVSEVAPYVFKLTEIRNLTAGLNHVRLASSLVCVKKELDKMVADGLLESYTVDEVFPIKRPRGRPVPIDYDVTLFPGREWLKNVKAGHVRLNVSERRLGLPRSMREERQMTLPSM